MRNVLFLAGAFAVGGAIGAAVLIAWAAIDVLHDMDPHGASR